MKNYCERVIMGKEYVSVIVPVYNSFEHIEGCLESICNQTYQNLEIIVVNDGSKDKSYEKCLKKAQQDKRIKIFNTENKGVSHARNYGLSKASGEYIKFIDADDTMTFNSIEFMLNNMKCSNTDMVVCGYVRVLPEIKLWNDRLERPGIYDNRKYLLNTLKDPGHHYYGVVWNKLYKRKIIEKNLIKFREDVTLGEDFIFNLNYLKYTQSVLVLKNKLYYYNCLNSGSLSRYDKNIGICKTELENRNKIFQVYKNVFIELDLYNENKKRVQRYWLLYLAMNLYYIKYEFNFWNKDDLEKWKQILQNSCEIKKCINTVSKFKMEMIVMKIWIDRSFATNMKLVLRKFKALRR